MSELSPWSLLSKIDDISKSDKIKTLSKRQKWNWNKKKSFRAKLKYH